MMYKEYDLIIIGSTIGGVLSAYSASKMGLKVAMISEFPWIGGQFTSECVPPDENIYIEDGGASQTYLNFRKNIRSKYLKNPHLKKEYYKSNINPGGGWVSYLCALPSDYLEEFNHLLKEGTKNKLLDIYYYDGEFKIEKENDNITHIYFRDNKFKANYFIDSSLFGDFMVKAGAKYLVGAESKEVFNEKSAPIKSDIYDVQPVTWVAAVSFNKNEDNTIEKPILYDYFKKLKTIDNKKILSFEQVGLNPDEHKIYHMFSKEEFISKNIDDTKALFDYRKVFDPNKYDYTNETPISLINWPQNDYIYGNILFDKEEVMFNSKQLTLSLIYWLQTEAPRDDGGFGYKELKLRPDITNTKDGLAMSPYLRETYRLDSMYVVNENDVTKKTNFFDSIGIGHYNIDLHMTYASKTHLYLETKPFEIPMGSLISKNIGNMLAGSKNIGTSHIANGCYRLHPIEWNIGESAGYLVGFAKNKNIKDFRKIYEDKKLIEEFQELISSKGVKIRWEKVFKNL